MDEHVCDVSLYTDGGFQPSENDSALCNDSWSLVVAVKLINGSFSIAESMGGRIELDPTSKGFLGISSPTSSYSNETHALTIARICILQNIHRLPSCTCVNYMYDNIAAGNTAAGARFSRSQPLLSKFYLVLDRACAMVCRMHNVSAHVKSHDSHPINEYADSICTHILKNGGHVPMFTSAPVTEHVIQAVDLFLSGCSSRTGKQLVDPACANGIIYAIDAGTIAARLDCTSFQRNGDKSEGHIVHTQDVVFVPVHCLLYNVLSLADDAEKRAVHVLLSRNKIFLACVQEGRAKKSGVFVVKPRGCTKKYVVARSSGVKGYYGCEIWFSMSLFPAYCGEKKFTIDQACVSILVDRPRLLIIAVRCGPVFFAVVSVHAPHSQNAETLEWWKEYKSLIRTVKDSVGHVLIGIDGNITFPVECSEVEVGSVGSALNVQPHVKDVLPILADLLVRWESIYEDACTDSYAVAPNTYRNKDRSGYKCIDYFHALGMLQYAESQ